MSVTILYLERSMWEYDFIVHDICCNIENKVVECFSPEQFTSLSDRKELYNKNILVINHVCDFNDIVNVVTKIKPLVIFYLSDEEGCRPNTTTLQYLTSVIFMQYRHNHYSYSKNAFQLPCAYVSGYLHDSNGIAVPSVGLERKPMTDRRYNCSFVGAIKSDRGHMAEVFRSRMAKTNIHFVDNNWNIADLAISGKQLCEMYLDSIFVLVGRGNSTLDCSRVYEAMVAGAIPVVIGPTQEVESTFNFNGNMPPFVYDETWEKASVKCNALLSNHEQLQCMQNQLITWWENRVEFMRDEVSKAINNKSPPPPPPPLFSSSSSSSSSYEIRYGVSFSESVDITSICYQKLLCTNNIINIPAFSKNEIFGDPFPMRHKKVFVVVADDGGDEKRIHEYSENERVYFKSIFK